LNKASALQLFDDHDMAHHTYRRLIGALLGAGLGLAYGLVSQTINMFALPGISFYQPPFGPWVNIAVYTAGAALLGLAAAWPADGVVGTLLGSAVVAVVFVAVVLLTTKLDPERVQGTVMAVAFLFLPAFGFLVPFVAVLRWAASQQEEARIEGGGLWKRLRLPIALLILVGAIGATSLYPPQGRAVISRMNALVQAGQQAPNMSSLPNALQPGDVNRFVERATASYTLEWQDTNLNRYAIPRPMSDPQKQSVVIARFENGWTVACLFANVDAEPECRDFEVGIP
jgi:hypothetical protein